MPMWKLCTQYTVQQNLQEQFNLALTLIYKKADDSTVAAASRCKHWSFTYSVRVVGLRKIA